MLAELSRLLMGYVEFEITGEGSRFLNLAVKKKIVLWGLQKEGKGARAKVKARDYRELWEIKRRCGVRMRHTKKHGLVFQTERLKKRKGLVIGAAVMLAVYLFLSSFIWNVQLSGNDTLTPAQVLSAAQNRGVFAGVSKNSFEPEMVARQLMLDLQDVSWITVNTDGCTVEIRMKELEKKPELAGGEVVADIVSNKTGRIISITAESGMPQVQVGDIVEEGQQLIAGVYQEKLMPYIEKQAPIKTFMVAARGEVIAETAHQFVVEVSELFPEETLRKTRSGSYINFFGLLIPMGLQSAPVGEYRVYEENSPLYLLDTAMPVGIIRQRYEYYEVSERRLTEEEMRQKALYQLREKQQEVLGGTGKILEETLDFAFADGSCVLTATCRCQENIGFSKEVSFEFPMS